MSEQVRPDEAARALAEIRQRQERVIDLALLPVWYWWVVAVLMVGLSVAVDAARHRPVVIGVAAVAFALSVVGVTAWLVLGAWRRAQWRNDLLGGRGALAIITSVWLVVGVTLGIAFGLQAAGVAYPATLASLVGAATMIAGSPLLTRVLRRIMLDHRTGSR